MSVCSVQNTTVTSDELPANCVTFCGVSQINTHKLITQNTHAERKHLVTLKHMYSVVCPGAGTHTHGHGHHTSIHPCADTDS